MVQEGLRMLTAAGFSTQRSIELANIVTVFTIGACLAEVGTPVSGSAAEPMTVISNLDPEAFSLVLTAFATFGYGPEAQFELGLAAMLAGLPDPVAIDADAS